MRAVESRCPEAVDPQLSPKTRRAYFAERNSAFLHKAGRQLEEAHEKGEISSKALPSTYGILADKQLKLDGWGVEKEKDSHTFADTLAAGLMKAGGGKVMVSVEVETVNEDGEVIDVTPRDGEGG